MIYKKKYIRQLIKKKVLGELSAREYEELIAARKIYTDEEYEEMIAEVMIELKDVLPYDSLEDWKPDFDKIRSEGDADDNKALKHVWMYWASAVVASIALAYLLINHYLTNKEEAIYWAGACVGMTYEEMIPMAESSCVLRWDDSSQLYVGKDELGHIVQIGSISVSKVESGQIRLELSEQGGENGDYVNISTGALEQCVVELPDGNLVRLNAQSTLRYAYRDTAEIAINGEAYVYHLQKKTDRPLYVHTANGSVKSSGGDFAVLTQDNYTRVTLGAGRQTLYSDRLQQHVVLDCLGAEGYLVGVRVGQDNPQIRDSLIYREDANYAAAMRWTKAVRNFDNVSLADFTREMSRWYGFKIVNYDCIPKDRRISTTLCYRDARIVAYEAIRNAGVVLYEQGSMISFCEDENEGSSFVAWLGINR